MDQKTDINQQGGDEDFEALLESSFSPDRKQISAGEKIEARVVNVGREYVYLDLGTRTEGLLLRQEVLDEEATRGFVKSGVYRKRLAYFVDGLAVGTEQFLRDQIARMRENGQYLRRRNPIPQLGGVHMSLREQRSSSS